MQTFIYAKNGNKKAIVSRPFRVINGSFVTVKPSKTIKTGKIPDNVGFSTVNLGIPSVF